MRYNAERVCLELFTSSSLWVTAFAGGGDMDRYITKTKYFSPEFNTAIFSDPIRIYFSNEQESQALELYFKLQSRKNQWEKFLRARGTNNYCYIMLYSDDRQFKRSFADESSYFAPGEMGEDYILGIKGPMTPDLVTQFFVNVDQRIGFIPEEAEINSNSAI